MNKPKTEEDFLQYSANLVKLSGAVTDYIKNSDELKRCVEKQYLLNEALGIGDNSEGYDMIKFELKGISGNFCGSNVFNLKSDYTLAKDVLELVSEHNRKRIVELKANLQIS